MHKLFRQQAMWYWLQPQLWTKVYPSRKQATAPLHKSVGKLIAERAKAAGITSVAFDRSGFRYHGRIKALADAAREAGLSSKGPSMSTNEKKKR